MIKAINNIIVLISFLGFCFPLNTEAFDKKGEQKADTRSYQSIPEAKFQEAFIEYVYRRLGKEKSDIVVSKFKVIGNKSVPAGNVKLQLFKSGKRRLEGYVRLTAVISVDGKVKNKVKLSGHVDLFEYVVCTARNLKRGETIKEGDVYMGRKNISRISSKILTDINRALGLMVKHTIKSDTCLKEWMLGKSPIVTKGDMVTILAESNGLKVTVPGKVLMKGYLGELVKIQNLMSKREIYAKVINNSTVKVDF